jgi:hypothetical protein
MAFVGFLKVVYQSIRTMDHDVSPRSFDGVLNGVIPPHPDRHLHDRDPNEDQRNSRESELQPGASTLVFSWPHRSAPQLHLNRLHDPELLIQYQGDGNQAQRMIAHGNQGGRLPIRTRVNFSRGHHDGIGVACASGRHIRRDLQLVEGVKASGSLIVGCSGAGRSGYYKSATLKLMMSREERIEYEILDCALRADVGPGYLTDAKTFTQLLRKLFPDIQPQEFTDTCKKLIKEGRVDVRYQDGEDEQMVFAGRFYLACAPRSHEYLEELRQLIELPTSPGGKKLK